MKTISQSPSFTKPRKLPSYSAKTFVAKEIEGLPGRKQEYFFIYIVFDANLKLWIVRASSDDQKKK